MNDDYARCWDYEKGVCPEECFRAKLTDDLKNWPHPVTYSKFKGTEACPLTNPQPKRTHGDKIRSSTDEELAEMHVGVGCPPGTDLNELCFGENGEELLCTPPRCRECWFKWLRQEDKE